MHLLQLKDLPWQFDWGLSGVATVGSDRLLLCRTSYCAWGSSVLLGLATGLASCFTFGSLFGAYDGLFRTHVRGVLCGWLMVGVELCNCVTSVLRSYASGNPSVEMAVGMKKDRNRKGENLLMRREEEEFVELTVLHNCCDWEPPRAPHTCDYDLEEAAMNESIKSLDKEGNLDQHCSEGIDGGFNFLGHWLA